jgi:hypothetical protein
MDSSLQNAQGNRLPIYPKGWVIARVCQQIVSTGVISLNLYIILYYNLDLKYDDEDDFFSVPGPYVIFACVSTSLTFFELERRRRKKSIQYD